VVSSDRSCTDTYKGKSFTRFLFKPNTKKKKKKKSDFHSLAFAAIILKSTTMPNHKSNSKKINSYTADFNWKSTSIKKYPGGKTAHFFSIHNFFCECEDVL